MRPAFSLFLVLLLHHASSALGQTAPPDTTAAARTTHVESLPVFPVRKAGDSTLTTSQRLTKFLNEDFTYPPKALREGIGGRVFISFTVDAQGHTTDIRLVKGVREDIDAAALRSFHRLESIQWHPGLQDGRPVKVVFTAPFTFSVSSGRNAQAVGSRGGSPADSLEMGPYQKLAFPLPDWNGDRLHLPAGKGLIYGSCLQRLGGSTSLGTGEYVRLVNLTTQKSFRINVKPILNSRRENAFCYALPAGRYALFLYEYPDPKWGGYRMHVENLRKPANGYAPAEASLQATRYLFTVAAGRVHYVGTWNLANENEPDFLEEKTILDSKIQARYESLRLAEATVAIPK